MKSRISKFSYEIDFSKPDESFSNEIDEKKYIDEIENLKKIINENNLRFEEEIENIKIESYQKGRIDYSKSDEAKKNHNQSSFLKFAQSKLDDISKTMIESKKNAELEIIKSFGEIIIDVASESIDIKFKNQVVDIIHNLFSKIYDESLFKIYIDSNYMDLIKNTPEINNLLSEYNVQIIETKTKNKGDLKISWENGEIQSSLNEFHEKISQLISSQER